MNLFICLFDLLAQDQPYKMYNESCRIFGGECDSSQGLYCPSGVCECRMLCYRFFFVFR